MRITVNGRVAGTKQTGCAICGGTWGSYYQKIDGEEVFFCCDVCAKEFDGMIQEAKRRAGWEKVEEVDIRGSWSAGRHVRAKSGAREIHFYINFDEDGNIRTFKEE